MKTVSVHEAKTHLSRLLLLVKSGEEVVITHSGVAVAKLVSFRTKHGLQGKGVDAGKATLSADFDVPLPSKWQKLFK